MSSCIVIPALDAEATLGGVIDGLREAIPACPIFVVDDGSSDATSRVAEEHGAIVVRSPERRGKGAALRTGFAAAAARGMTTALTVDADGQHPPDEARRVLFGSADASALVLGVRDLVRAGAPRPNRISNGISNFFISHFAGRRIGDTQCGLRRYPIAPTLALGSRGQGFDFEAEMLLRAIWSGMPVVEVPVRVLYPADRQSHFRIRRDVTQIIQTIVASLNDRRPARDSLVEGS